MGSDGVMVSVQHVSFSYPVKTGFMQWTTHTPLRNISFDLNRGETIGVVGRNGTGKSTLLRLIAGITEPDSGRIVNHGARVSLLSLGVGFMPHLTGRQNAILSGILLGLRKKEIAGRLDQIIEFSGLGDFIDQPLRTYSSGMRARLGFSTAIQVDPDVLLIDETLGVGDEEFKKKSTDEIKRLISSEKTVVLVSHAIPVIRDLSDRVMWLADGSIKKIGDKKDVIDAYLAVA